MEPELVCVNSLGENVGRAIKGEVGQLHKTASLSPRPSAQIMLQSNLFLPILRIHAVLPSSLNRFVAQLTYRIGVMQSNYKWCFNKTTGYYK